MGEVYRARDTRLGRDVAVKVIRPRFAADVDKLRRFEQEARATSQLDHANILVVHDIGSHEGNPYIVSELLEGESLREKLGAPLPPKRAIDYATQVAHGLAAAHDKGIIHRDLKPENLFVTKDGRVKILDFGLAKLIQPASPPVSLTEATTAGSATETGVVMGTMDYMSPEQVRGLVVDHRSDIFSFGAILYEMLSGSRAFSRPTVADTVSAILREEPPELSQSDRNISLGLDHILRHCLEKDRDARFQSASDIAFDLAEQSAQPAPSGAQLAARPSGKSKRRIAAAATALLVVAGVLLLRRPHGGNEVVGGVKRVAVLPFENLGAPEDDYFADGTADEIRSKLTSLPGVEVIARASSTPYKKTTKTPNQIARELDVNYLLMATVRWQKAAGTSRVLVTPELVEVQASRAPASKWQQPFDAALTDVFQVQSDIASRVAEALGVALGAGEQKRLSAKPTENLAAYDAFLKGEEAANGLAATDFPSLRRALDFYDQAVARDPGFAQAWARVSYANSLLYSRSTPTPALAERALQAAQKAVALAPDRPEGYLALGTYQRAVSLDYGRALDDFEKGLRVAPGDASLVRAMAFAEQGLGRFEAALGHLRKAERLDPLSPDTQRRLGELLLCLRRYPEAREALDRGLAATPASINLIEFKAMTFLGEGNLAGARAVLGAAPREVDATALVAFVASSGDLVWLLDEEQRELLLRLTPSAFDGDQGLWALNLAQASALKGDTAGMRAYAEKAKKAFAEQVRAVPDNAALHACLGLALAQLGEKKEAIREGKRAVALDPVAKDARDGPYFQHQLVRIYLLVGEPEKALDLLQPLLGIPSFLSPGWLEIDPNFDPLRHNPRFQKLVAAGK
jgi:TolB-like protein/Flp pilus assembly protein TadD